MADIFDEVELSPGQGKDIFDEISPEPSNWYTPVTDLFKGIYTGFTRRIPEQIGQSMQFAGISPDAGKAITEWAREGEEEGEKGMFTQAGEMIPASAAVPMTLNAIGRAVGFIPHPIAKVVGLGMQGLSYVAAPLLFGLSQAQETKDTGEKKIADLEKQIAEASPEDRSGLERELSRVKENQSWAPWATGGIEMGGETLANWALLRLLGPLAPAGKLAEQSLKSVLKPTLSRYTRELAFKTLPTEILTEMGQNAGESLVEKGAGVRPEANPWAEAVGAVGPTAIMTLLMGGGGRVLQSHVAGNYMNILSDGEEDPARRNAISDSISSIIRDDYDDPQTAALWSNYAKNRIANGEDIDPEMMLDTASLAPDLEDILRSAKDQSSNIDEMSEKVVDDLAATDPLEAAKAKDIIAAGPSSEEFKQRFTAKETRRLESNDILRTIYQAIAANNDEEEGITDLIIGEFLARGGIIPINRKDLAVKYPEAAYEGKSVYQKPVVKEPVTFMGMQEKSKGQQTPVVINKEGVAVSYNPDNMEITNKEAMPREKTPRAVPSHEEVLRAFEKAVENPTEENIAALVAHAKRFNDIEYDTSGKINKKGRGNIKANWGYRLFKRALGEIPGKHYPEWKVLGVNNAADFWRQTRFTPGIDTYAEPVDEKDFPPEKDFSDITEATLDKTDEAVEYNIEGIREELYEEGYTKPEVDSIIENLEAAIRDQTPIQDFEKTLASLKSKIRESSQPEVTPYEPPPASSDLEAKSNKEIVSDIKDILLDEFKDIFGNERGSFSINDLPPGKRESLYQRLKPLVMELLKRARAKYQEKYNRDRAEAYVDGSVDTFDDKMRDAVMYTTNRYLDEEEFAEKAPEPKKEEKPAAPGELFNTDAMFTLSGNQPVKQTTFKPGEKRPVRLVDVEKQNTEDLRDRLTGEKAKREYEEEKEKPKEITYEEFAKQFRDAFEQGQKYSPQQAGFSTYADAMVKLADDYPEYMERFDKEIEDRIKSDKTGLNRTESDKPKLEDFGEHIGGSRKDTAERGYTMSKTEKKGETEPAWKKRYIAMEKVDGSGTWVIHDTKSDTFVRSGYKEQTFTSQEEAEKAIPLYAVAKTHVAYPSSKTQKWEIFKRVGERKLFKVVNKEFDSREDAMKYMASHAEEILAVKTTFGEEILPVPEKVTRKGVERRTGNADAEMFMNTFGFRGVEFGNWNNQQERQDVMNHAYDGLLDLAEVLDVEPKALSLNGDLALAFGARGQGLSGAKAHYESDYGVINLTKMSGAGSLAHEWFHSLDHYFGRVDTKASSEKEKNERGDLVYKTRGTGDYLSHGAGYKSQLRPEIKEAYENLIDTMFKKAEQYVEDTQKAEQFLGKAREYLGNKLDAIRKNIEKDLTKEYTWRKNKTGLKPASAEQLAEFDKLANILIEGGDLETRSKKPEKAKSAWTVYYTNDTLDGISAMLKAVRNRTGFNAEHTGTLDTVRAAMKTYSERLKMFNDAQAGTEKTKQVPTSYAMEAKKMDQARAGNYWSEPHEMAARAFASYVEDKIAEKGGQSDFLVYHAHGGILVPMIDGFIARPYPERKERDAINKAFDNFIQALETKETEKGTAFFFKEATYRIIRPMKPIFTVATLKENLRPVLAKLSKQVDTKIEVIQNNEGFPKDFIERAGSSFDIKNDKVYGAWDPKTNTLYLIADSLPSAASAERVIIEELVGHKGLNSLLAPSEMNKIRFSVYHQFKDTEGMKKTIRDYRIDISTANGRAKAGDEYMVHNMRDVYDKPTLMRKIAVFIRAALRRLGFKLEYNQDDIQTLMNRAWDHMKKGKAALKGEGGVFFRGQKPAPVWYSKMAQVLEKKLPGSNSAQGMKVLLQSWANKGEFKADELKWSGLIPWLEERSRQPETMKYAQATVNGRKVWLKDVKVRNGLVTGTETNAEGDEIIPKGKSPDGKPFTDRTHIIETSIANVKLAEMNKTYGELELSPQQDKVTKQEILDFVKANQVEIQEVTKGHEGFSGWRTTEPEMGQLWTNDRQAVIREISGDWMISSNRYDDIDGMSFSTLQGAKDVVERKLTGYGETKFSAYNLPGGENYRELLFTLPRTVKPYKDNYQSPHWSEPNVLAHVRFNDRTVRSQGANQFNVDYQNWVDKGKVGKAPNPEDYGKDTKVLFIEEIQSDWHQKGRKEGYTNKFTNEEKQRLGDLYLKRQHDALGITHNEFTAADQLEMDRLAEREHRATMQTVPPAPFSKTWHEFVLKRMLRYAAENGYDAIGWTTGEQQAERYGLSKQVRSIDWTGGRTGRKIVTITPITGNDIEFIVSPDGVAESISGGVAGNEFAGRRLNDIVGKEIADKILSGDRGGSLSGTGLKIGGEGSKGFYDKIIPDFLNKYGKQWGAKTGETAISVGKDLLAHRTYAGPEYTVKDILEKRKVTPNATVHNQLVGVYDAMETGMSFQDAIATEGSDMLAEYLGGKMSELPTKGETVHSLPITPSMKESVLYEGQPMFKKGREKHIPWNEFYYKVLGNMDLTDSYGRVDDAERKNWAAGADYWTLEAVDPDTLATVPNAGVDMSKPIIIDGNGDVLDGRNRRARAINKRVKAIAAWKGYSNDSEAFRKWFGNSKVVDENGNPLVVYHGTAGLTPERVLALQKIGIEDQGIGPKGIDEFKTPAWFGYPVENFTKWTNQEGGKYTTYQQVIPAYLSIQNPYRATQREIQNKPYDAEWVEEKIKQGYDGAIWKTYSNAQEQRQVFVAFFPSQIKSVYNRGTWNPEDEQISFRKELVTEPSIDDTAEDFKTKFNDQVHGIKTALAEGMGSPLWREILGSPEWHSHPVMQELVKLFTDRRSELYHDRFNYLVDADAKKNVVDELHDLKVKGLSIPERLAGKTSEEYQMLESVIDEGDANKIRPEKMEKLLRDRNTPEDVVRVWKRLRESWDKALDLMKKQMKELIAEGEGSAKPGAKRVYDQLREALALIEDWRGSYAPRIRPVGNYVLQATKGEDKEKEYFRTHGSARQMDILASQMRRQGWVTKVDKLQRLPESTYQNVKTVEVANLIEHALKGIKDPALAAELNDEVLQLVADTIRARGYRQTMIHRGKRLITGYITDPMERYLKYTNSLAGGLSKAEVARRAMEEFKEIDPAKESRIHNLAQMYIQENLRNIEAMDRAIGIAKSVATFKFLGFNLRSIGVNLTAVATTAPAAIQQYGLDGKGSMTKIVASIAKAGGDYAKFMAGKKLGDESDQRFLEIIKKEGYDDPQYARDAMGKMQKLQGKAWNQVMAGSMYLFGKSEQWNRGTTMLASFRLAKAQGMPEAEAMEKAREASNRAHGIYGKGTLPFWAMGENIGAKVGQMMYVYGKFGHNYVQMLYDLGMKRHNIKAFLWAIMSPLVVAGAVAFPFRNEIMFCLKAALRAVGIDDDPEKWWWDIVRRNLGKTAELAGRHGLTGLAGIDISGSLSVGVGIPTGLIDLTGAVGGVGKDIAKAMDYMNTGQPLRAVEKGFPTGIGNILRAVRENARGVTTEKGKPVWNEEGRQFKPSSGQTALRGVGFRSSEQAILTERTQEAKKIEQRFTDKRTEIYEAYRAWFSNPDKKPGGFKEIFTKIKDYNQKVLDKKLQKEVPLINAMSLRSQAKSVTKPTTKERLRLMER